MRSGVGALLISLVIGGIAAAQPSPPPPLVGTTELHRITPAIGFIDEAIAVEGDQLAYVTSDGATQAQLHVASISNRADRQTVDLWSVTHEPRALRFVGAQVLVIGAAGDNSGMIAALLEIERPKARPVHYKITGGSISLIERDGKARLAVRDTTQLKNAIRHTVSLYSIETGRRIGAPKPFETDPSGKHVKLDFQINHWSDGGTRAHGIRGGTWNKKDDQRSPDVEASYDLLTGKLATAPITDLHEQRRRFQMLRDAGGADFVRVDAARTGLVIARGGKPSPIALDQPFSQYLPASLQAHVARDHAWLALAIDKVHPDAVARKKADIEYLDVFRAGADNQATRKARVLVGKTQHGFGAAGTDRFWLLERSGARVGKTLVIYQAP